MGTHYGAFTSHQAIVKDKVARKPKSNNYSELTIVNVADIWRERNVWYQGRSRQRMETEYEIKTKYRMLKALGLEHWKAKELACSRKGYWRMAQVLNSVITNKIIAKLGYTSMLDYYLVVCEN